MKSSSFWIRATVVLACTCAVITFFLWRAHLRIASLESGHTASNAGAERLGSVPESETTQTGLSESMTIAGSRTVSDPVARAQARMVKVMASTRFQRASAQATRAKVRIWYEALLREFSLPEGAEENLIEYLVDDRSVLEDAMLAGAQEGMSMTDTNAWLPSAIVEARSRIDSDIARILGEQRLSRYLEYKATLPARLVLKGVQGDLATETDIISRDDIETVASILTEEDARLEDSEKADDGGTLTITETALERVRPLLSDAAFCALRNRFEAERTQRELQEAAFEASRNE